MSVFARKCRRKARRDRDSGGGSDEGKGEAGGGGRNREGVELKRGRGTAEAHARSRAVQRRRLAGSANVSDVRADSEGDGSEAACAQGEGGMNDGQVPGDATPTTALSAEDVSGPAAK